MISSKFLQGVVGLFAMQFGGCIIFGFDQNICGDNDVDQFEECDDGNGSNADACLNTCEASFCGDGFFQPQFEECDGGAGCDQFCNLVVNEFCGDGFIDAGEDCDDGNLANFDGCDSNCFAEQTGDVLFDYVLLQPGVGGGPIEAAVNCADAGVLNIHFMLGDDFNGNATLDDNEIIQEAFLLCDQADTDGSGSIEIGELGIFDGFFFAGTFDLFAVEFLNRGVLVPWQTFDVNTNFTRFSFAGGITVTANATTTIPFDANPLFLPQLGQELQAFFGF
jgi:cysteine-rich repeat protein